MVSIRYFSFFQNVSISAFLSASSVNRPWKLKRWARIGMGLLVSVALLPPGALLLSEQLLRIDKGGQQTEVMVVLGGDTIHRPQRALELYQSGMVAKVIISGAGDC